MDLICWNLTEVGGWKIETLATDILLNLWEHALRRELKKRNDYNYAAAVLVAIDQATKAEETKINVAKWLPYDLSSFDKPVLPATVQEMIAILIGRGELPADMIQDLKAKKYIAKDS